MESFDRIKSLGHYVDDFKAYVDRESGESEPNYDDFVEQFLEWKRQLDQLVIDESNFNQYFFDARFNEPQPGQVLACYQATAELGDGSLKRDIMNELSENKPLMATKIMQKIGGADEKESIRIVKEINNDLISGMAEDEVYDKRYPFRHQNYFYTYRGCVPKNDPHWSNTSLLDIRTSRI